MKNIDFSKATRLDLEIWDTQNKIKYIKLPTRKARKSELILSQTKGVRTNTNRGNINTKFATIILPYFLSLIIIIMQLLTRREYNLILRSLDKYELYMNSREKELSEKLQDKLYYNLYNPKDGVAQTNVDVSALYDIQTEKDLSI